MNNLIKSTLNRLEKRKLYLDAQYERIKRKVLLDKVGGEEDRLWLEQYTNNPPGLDICCGDFLIGKSTGVDSADDTIGSDWFLTDGSTLRNTENNSQNFIVSNYLDAFIDTLSTLRSWHRVLIPSGTLALVVRNSDNYDINTLGPFINNKRVQAFTLNTLTFFLRKCNFSVEEIKLSKDKTSIYYTGKKL